MTSALSTRQPRGFSLADVSSRFGLVAVWVVMIVTFSLLVPDRFLTTQNLGNVFGSQAVLLILALGLMIPVIAGEWDLSVGATLGLSLTIVGTLNAKHGLPIAVSIGVAIAASLLVGFVNAFFVVAAGVPSLIATLGMATLLAGVTYGISNTTIAGLDPAFVAFGQAQFLSIPIPFYIAITLAIVIWYVLRWTPGGRYLYFVGASSDVARLAGVRVNNVRASSLVTSSVVAGISGIVLAASLGASGPTIGPGYLLPAFAAIFLGSTCLTPGRINVWGAVIAVYFLITGVSGMQLLGAASWIQDVFYGAIVIVAVALSRLSKRNAT